MTIERVFSEQPIDPSAPALELSREEAHHLLRVRRARDGAPVRVLDGCGHCAEGALEVVDRNHARVRVESHTHCAPPAPACHLAVALPTGKTMDWIVQKATELGAASITPLLSERSEVQLDERRTTEKLRRWNTIAIESVKQCGNPHLPEIRTPVALRAFLAATAALPQSEAVTLIASLEAPDQSIERAARAAARAPAAWTLLVGPEGDFSPAEYAAARAAHAIPVSLGPLVLRVETAAITGLARLIAAVRA